ncbi:MAG: AmmeMemoRadiSam system protein A [Armatimonadetes bacterium]|nr:AmmeMemoRadiSam system protein A [Armatimonadota bacterium]
MPSSDSTTLEESAQRELLEIARRTLCHFVCEGVLPCLEVRNRVLLEHRGAFVTLKAQGQLRGCIGYPEPVKPLYQAVASATRSAASEDPRFSPVGAEELEEITIDVSVLTLPVKVLSIEEIVIGTHGLIIRKKGRSGLLLPQVATEHGLDRDSFLEHTAMKAGLPPDAWKEGAEILRFRAEVFGEDRFEHGLGS